MIKVVTGVGVEALPGGLLGHFEPQEDSVTCPASDFGRKR